MGFLNRLLGSANSFNKNLRDRELQFISHQHQVAGTLLTR